MNYSIEQMQSLLPDSIAEVAEVLGMPATLMLVEKLGGTSLHVPQGANRRGLKRLNQVAAQIGQDNANKLAEFCCGEPLYIPRCDVALRRIRDLTICDKFEQGVRAGKTANEVVVQLALEYRLTDRWIWKILKNTVPSDIESIPDLFH